MHFFFFLMIRRPPRSTLDRSSAASDVYKRQVHVDGAGGEERGASWRTCETRDWRLEIGQCARRRIPALRFPISNLQSRISTPQKIRAMQPRLFQMPEEPAATQLDPAALLAPRADQRRQAGDGAHGHATAEVALQPIVDADGGCLLYTSPSPRDRTRSRMPSSA